jgi:hypothetical protein
MSRVDLANDLLASLHDAAEIFVNGAMTWAIARYRCC